MKDMKMKDMKVFGRRIISLFSVLLIMFSIIPYCVLAEEATVAPSTVSEEEAFALMKERMAESIDNMIENLENSKEELDSGALEEADELIAGLESVKEELEAAETDSEMLNIRDELNSLLEEAPEELRSVLGPAGQLRGPGQGPGPAGNGTDPEGFENRPEPNPEMMNNTSRVRDANAEMEARGITDPASEGVEEKAMVEGNATKESKSEDIGFFAKLINSLRSLFS